jgi:glycosyltransferase involved in cell wall biosynthesis
MMDIFILPSLSEGLSVAILEAMAAGKPVVATQVGGNPELVMEGETGLLVPPKNSQALGSRIVYLLREKEWAKELGLNGRERVMRHFTLTQGVESYEQLYEMCLNSKKNRATGADHGK